MERLINDSRPGEVGVIQYSGHGIQVKDLDGDEADGQDEAIVPIDFESGRFIIDDDLRGLLQVIPEGVSLTCFMECCHSGTKTRLFVPNPVTERGASKPRFMRITAELNERHISSRARPSACEAGERRNAGSELCPCLSEQVAYETEGWGDITRRALPILRAGTSA